MKKFILLLLVLFVGISLTACDDKNKDTTSKNVAYGDLSSEIEYASVGELKLSEKALYDELRVNAYDYLLDEMVKTLVKPASDWTVQNKEAELTKIVNENCYGTSDEKALKEMSEDTRKTSEKKFADQMYLLGIDITDEAGVINVHSEDCLAYFMDTLAQKEYVRSLLTTSTSKYYYANEFQKNEKGEDILDENGDPIKNPYYISDDAIESAYNSNYNKESKYNVVIVSYTTAAEAIAALEGYDTNNLTYDQFKEIYYARYDYKERTDNNFMLTATDLNSYDSTVVSLIKNMNKNFDQLDSKYLINQQLGKNVYCIYLNEKNVEGDFAGLIDKNEIEAAKKTTIEKIIEDKLTASTISSLLFEKLYDTEVIICDYVFDALYAVENSKHKRLEATAWKTEYNDYVAIVGNEKIKVRDFYNELEKLLGISTAMDYFTSEIISTSEFMNKVNNNNDDLKEIDKQIESVMTSFKNNELAANGYPTTIGEDVFKFIYFGSNDDAEIKSYYKAQKAWEYYTENKSDDYFELVYEIGKQYAGYTNENNAKVEGKYFDLSVKHILLTVDYNGDGTADDPQLFISKLSVADQTEVQNAIVTCMDAIVKEVNWLVDNDKDSMLDALDAVLKRFYANEEVLHTDSTTDTWNNYKSKFNLGLTIEDLGSVNNSSASRYVKEFSIGVEKLYQELKTTIKNDKDKPLIENGSLKEDYLANEVTNINELIPTSFGYHILCAYNTSKLVSAKYSESSDDTKQYQNIKVTLNGDPITIENAYNSNEYASINQIKIYVAQLNTDDGVTDLPSGAKSFIAKFYSDFTNKYENATFQNILFAYNNFEGLTFKNEDNNTEWDEFLEIQKRQFESYQDEDIKSISIFSNWWKLVDEILVK